MPSFLVRSFSALRANASSRIPDLTLGRSGICFRHLHDHSSDGQNSHLKKPKIIWNWQPGWSGIGSFVRLQQFHIVPVRISRESNLHLMSMIVHRLADDHATSSGDCPAACLDILYVEGDTA